EGEPVQAAPVAAASTADEAGIARRDVVVSMRGVARKFGDRLVVRDIDLVVPRGTILGIIGPSGAGKTTTIRMLTGALKPTTGEVEVLGRSPNRFGRAER